MNYKSTFIAVATDCALDRGTEPPMRGGKKTIARIQYELLIDTPYELTQEDVLWRSHALHKNLVDEDPPDQGDQPRTAQQAFFAKPQPCLRASPLAKSYGWGFHFDSEGRTALVPREAPEYEQLHADPSLEQRTAMASRRGARG